MKRMTIEDVAREAGVSRQTVSRAINNKAEISEATRARVMAVVERLGYRPNRLAQGMVTQQTRTIGLEVPDITNPVFAEMARGVQDYALEREYNLFLVSSEDNPRAALEMLETLVMQGVDGLIALIGNTPDRELRRFADDYRPIVLVNRDFDHPNISGVGVDLAAGAELVAAHFAARGHQAIGMIAPAATATHETRRQAGFRRGLEAHGLTLPDDRVAVAPATHEGGVEGAHRLLQQRPEISALFSYNDMMAVGALQACRALERRVPTDVAVVGFDDIALATLVTPSLSTVNYDKYRLGRAAAERLLAMIEVPDVPFSPVEIELTLVLRESTEGLTPASRRWLMGGVDSPVPRQ